MNNAQLLADCSGTDDLDDEDYKELAAAIKRLKADGFLEEGL